MIAPGKPMALIGKKKLDILNTPSATIEEVTDDILRLASRMFVTCIKNEGHAIAAVQVGIPINLVVTAQGEAFYNVGVSTVGSKQVTDIEGCLSVPGRMYEVPRHKKIEWSGTNFEGKFEFKKLDGFEARLWQHEYEHLQGKLISQLYNEIFHVDVGDSEIL